MSQHLYAYQMIQTMIFVWSNLWDLPITPFSIPAVGHLATGCPDPLIPNHILMQREGDVATISCPGPSDISWDLTCRGGRWLGSYGNCSTGEWEICDIFNMKYKDIISCNCKNNTHTYILSFPLVHSSGNVWAFLEMHISISCGYGHSSRKWYFKKE